MVDNQNQASTDPSQEVDRVRDILFGPQLRDYEQRFEVAQGDLDRLQDEINRLNELLREQDAGQLKRLHNLHREMRQADDTLRSELRQAAQQLMTEKVDRVDLGQLFIELGNHLVKGVPIADVLKDLTVETLINNVVPGDSPMVSDDHEAQDDQGATDTPDEE